MNSINDRYKVFPQMMDYDTMASGQFAPYSMLAGPYNFRSERVNTDGLGFRWTKSNEEISSVEKINEYSVVNIIVGGSTVFGVGSADDSTTISSKLENLTQQKWINFGVRGCNSIQEYIHLIQNLHKAKKINNLIFVSGINDLYLTLVNETNDKYDFGFGAKYSKISAYHPYHQSFAIFFSKIYGLDYNLLIKMSKRKMIFPFNQKANDDVKILDFSKRIDRMLMQYKRNFKLYKGLQSSFEIKNVCFIFQPIIYWSKKTYSKNENNVIKLLNKLQKDSPWIEFKEHLVNSDLRERLDYFFNDQATKSNISYFNSNYLFRNETEDCFVDSVHLTDFGNYKIAQKITEII